MRRITHGLGIALTVMLWANWSISGYAQDEKPRVEKLLDKKITMQADHERLDEVLQNLAKAGYFTFSYQSDILKKDRLVTLSIKESTLREALELILGKTYDYLESDDYVVIRRRDAVAAKARTSPVMVLKEIDPDVDPMMKRATMMKIKHKTPMMKKFARFPSDSLNTADSLNISAVRQTVRDIISDMVGDGIIKDKGDFTYFALDDGQFVVDGKQMTDSMRGKYAKKYVKPDGNGYYCGTLAGVKGRGYFFDKNEIYGGSKQ